MTTFHIDPTTFFAGIEKIEIHSCHRHDAVYSQAGSRILNMAEVKKGDENLSLFRAWLKDLRRVLNVCRIPMTTSQGVYSNLGFHLVETYWFNATPPQRKKTGEIFLTAAQAESFNTLWRRSLKNQFEGLQGAAYDNRLRVHASDQRESTLNKLAEYGLVFRLIPRQGNAIYRLTALAEKVAGDLGWDSLSSYAAKQAEFHALKEEQALDSEIARERLEELVEKYSSFPEFYDVTGHHNLWQASMTFIADESGKSYNAPFCLIIHCTPKGEWKVSEASIRIMCQPSQALDYLLDIDHILQKLNQTFPAIAI